MKTLFSKRFTSLAIVLFLLFSVLAFSQEEKDQGFIGKAELYKAKKVALDYLSEASIIRKFGAISDSIWRFAELGMQEFRSSAILVRTLEPEGFRVEKGVAGMPTCFVATWGKGEPVIGILGEFDALPMLSQKPLVPVKDPVVPGTIGHHWSTVASGYGSAAWKGLNTGVRVIAGTALDQLTDAELLKEIKKQFAEYSKDHPYKSFLPEGARPPLDLNRDLMEKYRNLMMQTETGQ